MKSLVQMTKQQNIKSGNIIKPFTSLRFVFAFFIFLHHFGLTLPDGQRNFLFRFIPIVPEAFIGVIYFFVLSGFVIAYSYQKPINQKQTSVKSFLSLRFARVIPLYLSTLFVAAILKITVFQQEITLEMLLQFIASFFLVQSFIPDADYYFAFNSLSWSISTEFFFYFMFPLVVFCLPKMKVWLKKYGIFLLLPALALLPPLFPESTHHFLFYINPLFRIVEFLAGIYLFNVFAKFKKPNFSVVGLSLIEIASVAVLLAFILLCEDIPLVYRHTFYYWIPTGILVFAFSFQAGFLSRILSVRWLVYFGELSFGFYLWQYIIVFMFNLWNTQYLHISNNLIVLILDFSLTIIMSHLTFKWIEKPGKKFILKQVNKW